MRVSVNGRARAVPDGSTVLRATRLAGGNDVATQALQTEEAQRTLRQPPAADYPAEAVAQRAEKPFRRWSRRSGAASPDVINRVGFVRTPVELDKPDIREARSVEFGAVCGEIGRMRNIASVAAGRGRHSRAPLAAAPSHRILCGALWSSG
jgi:hypothetical protein